VSDEVDFWQVAASQLGLFQATQETISNETSKGLSAGIAGDASIIVAKASAELAGQASLARKEAETASRTVSSRVAALNGLRDEGLPLVVDDFHVHPARDPGNDCSSPQASHIRWPPGRDHRHSSPPIRCPQSRKGDDRADWSHRYSSLVSRRAPLHLAYWVPPLELRASCVGRNHLCGRGHWQPPSNAGILPGHLQAPRYRREHPRPRHSPVQGSVDQDGNTRLCHPRGIPGGNSKSKAQLPIPGY